MCKFLIFNFLFSSVGTALVLLVSFYYLSSNLSNILWSTVNNNGLEMSDNTRDKSTYENAELTMMSFRKILTKGLLESLSDYSDNCVEELRGPIESAIEAVKNMKVTEHDGSLLLTFPYSNDGERLEYIAVAVRKYINSAGNEVVDYVIYTYKKPKQVVTGRDDAKSRDSLFWRIMKYLSLDFFWPENVMKSRIEALRADFFAELLKRGIVKVRAGQYILK